MSIHGSIALLVSGALLFMGCNSSHEIPEAAKGQPPESFLLPKEENIKKPEPLAPSPVLPGDQSAVLPRSEEIEASSELSAPAGQLHSDAPSFAAPSPASARPPTR